MGEVSSTAAALTTAARTMQAISNSTEAEKNFSKKKGRKIILKTLFWLDCVAAAATEVLEMLLFEKNVVMWITVLKMEGPG